MLFLSPIDHITGDTGLPLVLQSKSEIDFCLSRCLWTNHSTCTRCLGTFMNKMNTKKNILLTVLEANDQFFVAQDDLINKLYQGKLKDYVKCQQVYTHYKLQCGSLVESSIYCAITLRSKVQP